MNCSLCGAPMVLSRIDMVHEIKKFWYCMCVPNGTLAMEPASEEPKQMSDREHAIKVKAVREALGKLYKDHGIIFAGDGSLGFRVLYKEEEHIDTMWWSSSNKDYL